jgi:hypothetical protein
MVTVIAIMLPIALITGICEKIYDLYQIILEKRELRRVFNGKGTY